MHYTDHHKIVRALGCCVSAAPHPTIHHCHGGSIKRALGLVGMAQRQNHFLVIPLAAEYHTGDFGIDNGMGFYKGVAAWEAAFGTQLEHLNWVAGKIRELYGYDIWQLAGIAPPQGEGEGL